MRRNLTTLIFSLLALALLAGPALARSPKAPFGRLSTAQRRYAAMRVLQRTFTNQFNNDGALLHQVGRKIGGFNKSRVSDGQIDQLTRGMSTRQQQVMALNEVAKFSKSDSLSAAVVGKLRKLGDSSSYDALKSAIYRGSAKTIPQAVKAFAAVAKRDSTFAPKREVLDLSKYSSVRKQIEAVLARGDVQSIKPLKTDNKHAFDTYVVTFKNKLNGQNVKAVFKPTGPKENENWVMYSQRRHGHGGAHSFVAREVFAYQFDKKLGLRRVPPTDAALLNVPGLGHAFGSLQYFIPSGKALGSNWKDTRPQYKDFMRSKSGTRQHDMVKALSYIFSSEEHVPSNLLGGNKGNIMVAEPGTPFPVHTAAKRLMMIDNASAFTYKPNLSDSVLPLRFNPNLVQGLKKLKYGEWIDFAKPYIGKQEAHDSWNRIQHTLNVAKSRPEWSSLLRELGINPFLRRAPRAPVHAPALQLAA